MQLTGLDRGCRTRILPGTEPRLRRGEGLRVSPSVYTTLEELDRFTAAVEGVIRNGLPT